jgi:hypothetical protein
MSTNRWPDILSSASKVAADFEIGDTVPHKYLWRLAELPGEHKNATDADRLKFVDFWRELRAVLQKEHGIHIHNEYGSGWRLVPPEERVRVGIDDAHSYLRRGIARARGNLSHLPAGVSHATRKAGADTLAKLGIVASLMRRVRRGAREARPPEGDVV